MRSFFAAVLLCLLSFSTAAPAPLRKRAITRELYDRLNLYEQFAAASYCPNNNNSTGNKLTCSTNACPLVEQSNTATVAEFENSAATDGTGYVATDSTRGLIVVAFRGSQSVRNFLTDANFLLRDVDICADCRGFSGFWRSWLEVKSTVTAAVSQAVQANPRYQIVVAGHSLGAGIAAFAVAELRNNGYKAALYTYGAPRVGDSALSTYITNQAGGNYRVTHLNDPVPRLPPIFLGYVHISPEFYIASGNNVAVTPNDITQFNGLINRGGNTGNTGFDTSAHGWYFNRIAACYPDDLVEGLV